MTLKSLVFTMSAVLTFSVSVEAEASSGLANLFDSVQTSDPRAVSNQHGNVFTGGNVRIRAARASYDMVDFRPPSITSGCGGIDIFAGSFGLMSKDQLVQTGRALVQGASSYYFGLALAAICPLCNGEMSKLQDMVNQMNQFSRTSCEDATRMINTWAQTTPAVKNKIDGVNSAVSSMWSGLLGRENSQTEAQLNRNENKPGTVAGIDESVADMTILGNSMYMVIMNEQIPDANGVLHAGSVFRPGFLADTAVDAVNLFMSLGGAVVNVKDESQPNNLRSDNISPAFTLRDYFGIESNPDERPELSLHRCTSVSGDPASRCVVVERESSQTITPIALQIRDIVHGRRGVPNDGIFDRILHEDGARELTDRQRSLLDLLGMDVYGVTAMMVTMGITRESVANYMEHNLMLAIRDAFENELGRLIGEMEAATEASENEMLRSDALARFTDLHTDVKALHGVLNDNYVASQDAIKGQAELNVFLLQFQSKRTRN